MDKPDDIPKDVWDRALGLWQDEEADPGELIIARAIMASKAEEREAIAQFIFDAPAVVEHPAGPLYGAGFSAAVQMMCAAIRTRNLALGRRMTNG